MSVIDVLWNELFNTEKIRNILTLSLWFARALEAAGKYLEQFTRNDFSLSEDGSFKSAINSSAEIYMIISMDSTFCSHHDDSQID